MKDRHTFDRAEAIKANDGTWILSGVCYSPLDCGCKVVGGGILPSPLTVELCVMHSALNIQTSEVA